MDRRTLLTGLSAAALTTRSAQAARMPWLSPQLPAGTREEAKLVTLPDKRPLICLSDRPPNYEAPIQAFQNPITGNDQFFIRYHLAGVPDMDSLHDWSLTVGGEAAEKSVKLSLDDLGNLPQVEVAAVCQCSGNRRGLSNPHVAGVEWGYGAMGCATWRGPRLRDVLAKAGVKPEAVEIWLNGADHPVLPATPDFRKCLPLSKAMADETIIATQMNQAPLPPLNGYPARVVVPGWTSTYWMKHIIEIEVSAKPLDNFWMAKAYRVPAGMFPVEHPFESQNDKASWPITEIVVNSVIADPIDGDQVNRSGFTVKGVAWDRGHGVRRVEVSLDGGKSWQDAMLGRDFGPFAFRSFTLETGGLRAGQMVIVVRAVSNSGETQSPVLKFNPAGYHNNVPQRITVKVA
jgi:DMSO/TMAO reductase YedYZ molybdopterin-dependent catalytic subunit